MTETVAAPVDDADLLAEVTAWLDEHWDPDLTVAQWWELVGDRRVGRPRTSLGSGAGSATPDARSSPSAPPSNGTARCNHPVAWACSWPRPPSSATAPRSRSTRHVTAIYDGSVAWCQFFSEPGSGSDLAGLSTRATRDGDHWVITGQKVWSSGAMDADYGMLLARTDVDVPKHAGISWFAFRVDQPGVTIRPLVEITGHALFNEVFFDDAVVADADLIGGLNNGWAVANTTLMFERVGIGAGGTMSGFPPPGPKGGFLELRAGDAARAPPPGVDGQGADRSRSSSSWPAATGATATR